MQFSKLKKKSSGYLEHSTLEQNIRVQLQICPLWLFGILAKYKYINVNNNQNIDKDKYQIKYKIKRKLKWRREKKIIITKALILKTHL